MPVVTGDGSCCCGGPCTCSTYPVFPSFYQGCVAPAGDCVDGSFAHATVVIIDTLGTDYSCFNQTVSITRSAVAFGGFPCCGHWVGGLSSLLGTNPPGCCPDSPCTTYGLSVDLYVFCGSCSGAPGDPSCCRLDNCATDGFGPERSTVDFGCNSIFGGRCSGATIQLTTIALSSCGPRVLIVTGSVTVFGNTITATITFT